MIRCNNLTNWGNIHLALPWVYALCVVTTLHIGITYTSPFRITITLMVVRTLQIMVT